MSQFITDDNLDVREISIDTTEDYQVFYYDFDCAYNLMKREDQSLQHLADFKTFDAALTYCKEQVLIEDAIEDVDDTEGTEGTDDTEEEHPESQLPSWGEMSEGESCLFILFPCGSVKAYTLNVWTRNLWVR